jgi:hypothetical protein
MLKLLTPAIGHRSVPPPPRRRAAVVMRLVAIADAYQHDGTSVVRLDLIIDCKRVHSLSVLFGLVPGPPFYLETIVG